MFPFDDVIMLTFHCVMLRFVNGRFDPYSTALRHEGNCKIVSVSAKLPWRMWQETNLTNPTVQQYHLPQWTTLWQKCAHVLIFVQSGAFGNICLMLCGICQMALLHYITSWELMTIRQNKAKSNWPVGQIYLLTAYLSLFFLQNTRYRILV